MEFTGGTKTEAYKPRVEGCEDVVIHLRTATCGEYSDAVNASLTEMLTEDRNTDPQKARIKAEEILTATCVERVEGVTYRNQASSILTIGSKALNPGDAMPIETGPEFVDAMRQASVGVAFALIQEVIAVVVGRAKLRADVIPT